MRHIQQTKPLKIHFSNKFLSNKIVFIHKTLIIVYNRGMFKNNAYMIKASLSHFERATYLYYPLMLKFI